MSVLLLLVGLVGLWLGTELVVRTAVGLARRFGLSEAFLGLTVLSIGTDLPELVVAVTGGIRQLQGTEASGLVIGNAVGSAITQGSLVLGLAGLFGKLRLSPRLIRRDGFALTAAIAVLLLLGLDGRITRLEGGVLVAVYALYSGLLLRTESRGSEPTRESGRRLALGLAGGLLVVVLSAELVVGEALALAGRWQLDQSLLGVLLIGVGTSLPELALSLGAAAKGRPGLSVGNVIGSNVFDLLIPVGASALLHPLVVGRETLLLDLPYLLLIVAVSLLFFRRRNALQRGEAVALIALWVAFVATRVALNWFAS